MNELKEQILANSLLKSVKYIPIIYYKPLTAWFTTNLPYPKFYQFDDLTNPDNLKWVDGQPYELIIIGGNK